MNEGSVRNAVGQTVSIQIVGGKPKNQIRYGILVQQGIGRLERLGFGGPNRTHAIGCLGSVIIGRAVGQARQSLAHDSLIVRPAKDFGVLPRTCSTVRRPPIQGDRSRSSTDAHSLFEGIDGRTELMVAIESKPYLKAR